ncbi:hypothetical protein MATL_G00234460 [Megalops atlanticus]|uniref:Uncharacterized protein n=1 Tax=Megalops atlanticus TaxID=7932 RepID=A0A9D3PHV1_MEGAT|nr:hypothetical protein MATL_G00234460 [Megalops atlanticus]
MSPSFLRSRRLERNTGQRWRKGPPSPAANQTHLQGAPLRKILKRAKRKFKLNALPSHATVSYGSSRFKQPDKSINKLVLGDWIRRLQGYHYSGAHWPEQH